MENTLWMLQFICISGPLCHFLQEKDHDTIMQSWIILKRDKYSKENVSDSNFPLFDPPQPQDPQKARTFKFQQILTQQMLLNNFGSIVRP